MADMQRSIFIGYDPREAEAFDVCRSSILRHLSEPIPIHAVVLSDLIDRGLYRRPTERRDGRIFDLISRRGDYDGACSTEFALSRFLVKHLAREGLALFMDCDMLVRTDVGQLFAHCERTDPGRALWCVKHDHQPGHTEKMDRQLQTRYRRKNWSSVFVMDVEHCANRALSIELINCAPGRDLHAFCWLADCDIGGLDESWNWLVPRPPKIVHFTNGIPAMPGYEHVAFAHEWRDELQNVRHRNDG